MGSLRSRRAGGGHRAREIAPQLEDQCALQQRRGGEGLDARRGARLAQGGIELVGRGRLLAGAQLGGAGERYAEPDERDDGDGDERDARPGAAAGVRGPARAGQQDGRAEQEEADRAAR